MNNTDWETDVVVRRRYVIPDIPLDTDIIEFDDVVVEPVEETQFAISVLSQRSWFYWFPVGAMTEALVAETIGQSLEATLLITDAIELTANVTRCRRMALSLRQMAVHLRNGARLHVALGQTSLRVSTGLIDTLRIGQERGTVSSELRAFARRLRPDVAQRLIASVKRPAVTIRFAVNLARLLLTNRLNDDVVADAGRLSAPNDKRFAGVIESVTEAMQNGDSLSQAIQRHPSYFDRLFCRFVDCGSGREALRKNLLMLAGEA